jgi:probable F420-dependent oxidoreductase
MSVGIWQFFDGDPIGAVRETAAEVEELGFDALWFGEYAGRDAFTQAALILAATSRLTVATGIARFDRRAPITAEAATRALGEAYPGRFVAGLGGHFPGARPIPALREYLDGMDGAELPALPPPSPRPRRLIAALGPRALALAAERADGAHPYFVRRSTRRWPGSGSARASTWPSSKRWSWTLRRRPPAKRPGST